MSYVPAEHARNAHSTIAVPVVLLGTFAVSMFGYSINTLTMFGMVLAMASAR
jgi:multidrug efflux pump subunit AcrB